MITVPSIIERGLGIMLKAFSLSIGQGKMSRAASGANNISFCLLGFVTPDLKTRGQKQKQWRLNCHFERCLLSSRPIAIP